jgi:pimeloyl-ACP methyl ester carboxylesterase
MLDVITKGRAFRAGYRSVGMRYQNEILSVRGRQIRPLRGGKGQPLLYFHDAWSYTWQPVHDRLAARYEVIFPIHPGFEGSRGFEEMDRMEDLVFHYLEVLEALHLDQPILVGVSLGGWLATEFAVRYSAMLRAPVLVDALGLWVPGAPATDLFRLDAAQMRAAIFADPSSGLAHELVPDTPPPARIESTLTARRTYARFAWQFPDHPKLVSYLHRGKCPTLVVWGEADGVVPVSHGEVYQAEIMQAELAVLSACGHLPPIERPEPFAATVLHYLERHTAGA